MTAAARRQQWHHCSAGKSVALAAAVGNSAGLLQCWQQFPAIISKKSRKNNTNNQLG